MSGEASLGKAVGVFRCPNCGEFIDTSVHQCRFCGSTVDSSAARAAAETQARADQACSDASFLRTMAITLPVFLLISFIPIVGAFAGWGFLFLLLAVPIMVMRWWIKYRSIQISDSAYRQAKRSTGASSAIWAAMLVLWIFLSVARQSIR